MALPSCPSQVGEHPLQAACGAAPPAPGWALGSQGVLLWNAHTPQAVFTSFRVVTQNGHLGSENRIKEHIRVSGTNDTSHCTLLPTGSLESSLCVDAVASPGSSWIRALWLQGWSLGALLACSLRRKASCWQAQSAWVHWWAPDITASHRCPWEESDAEPRTDMKSCLHRGGAARVHLSLPARQRPQCPTVWRQSLLVSKWDQRQQHSLTPTQEPTDSSLCPESPG